MNNKFRIYCYSIFLLIFYFFFFKWMDNEAPLTYFTWRSVVFPLVECNVQRENVRRMASFGFPCTNGEVHEIFIASCHTLRRRTIVQLTLLSSVTLSIIFQTRSFHSLRLRKEKILVMHLHFHWFFWFSFNEPDDIFCVSRFVFRLWKTKYIHKFCEPLHNPKNNKKKRFSDTWNILNNLVTNCGWRTKIINSVNESVVRCKGTENMR